MGYKGKNIGYSYLDYGKAQAVLNGRNSRVIGNNTYLEKHGNGDITIRHWSTNIITFKPDGSIVINLNGYTTSTTKARIRTYLNCIKIWTRKGEDIITDRSGCDYYYYDGIVINADGSIDACPVLAIKLEKSLGREIPTKADLIKVLGSLTTDECMKVWGKYKSYRTFIAAYCPLEFLPLIISDYKNELWWSVANNRLRGVT